MRSYFPPVNSFMQRHSNTTDSNDFGFDSPTLRRPTSSIENHSSQKGAGSIDGLASSPDTEIDPRRAPSRRKNHEPSMVEQLPYTVSVVSRYGQITPPRLNSAASSTKARAPVRLDSQPKRRKRTTKAKVKTKELTKRESDITTRNCKSNHKSTKPATQPAANPGDYRREISLEKNRLAATKCRINKKEKIAQIQRNSNDKAVENTLLRHTILQMKEEAQQLQIILMSHSSSDHCKNPGSIHEPVEVASSDSYANQIVNNNFLSTQSQKAMRQLSHDQSMYGDFFQPREVPALPEFNLPADFEVCTPILGD